MKRACLGIPGHPCGILIPANTIRCPFCRSAFDRARMAKRGDIYNGDHRRRAKQTIEEQLWCTDCGRTDDLTADHLIAGDPDSSLVTRCRSCNSARANRARALHARALPRLGH